jgi:hypothetical protein
MAGMVGSGQYRNLTINGCCDARGQDASCEDEGTGRRQAGVAAVRTPAWRARAASTQRHSEQQRPWRPWRDAGGVMRARVHSQQRGQRRVVRWPVRARKERATARAGSGSTGEKKKEEASAGRKGERRREKKFWEKKS